MRRSEIPRPDAWLPSGAAASVPPAYCTVQLVGGTEAV